MKTQCQFLSEDEQSKVHQKSIKILEEVGVKFLSAKALKVLEKNGAKVDYSAKLAKIPREMVDQALKTAPKSFVLATPQKHPLPDDVIGKLEAIIRRAEEELE